MNRTLSTHQSTAPLPAVEHAMRRDRLNGTPVALAVGNDFRSTYLGNAIAAAGGCVAGTARDVRALERLLDRETPAALAVSHALPGRGLAAAIDTAIERGVHVIVVGPARLDPGSPLNRLRCMLDPCAGFQVVEAIADALGEAADAAPDVWSLGLPEPGARKHHPG
ncbi:hypothetical protein [Sphingomonas sp. Leaf343]|uniref:hypothetical protein n=1 Tax=Sphingomonas sp. Leaf343 TaxID=1736345 RepID=UPI0006F6CAA4|nr:hypothetical protein [Sphingomonas sp. Leaf343]KQR82297.1 hypothetical protein ASG07_11630 [Sphingomonas sp. Leaf343]